MGEARGGAREEIDAAVRALDLLPDSVVLLGVSGGPDSVALLRSFVRVAALGGPRPRVLHVHHGLRGEAADGDAEFVVDQCRSLGVPCEVTRVDTLSRAAVTGESLETAARELRLEALARAARESGAIAIALAHTLDDQAETVLLHLLRGAGLAGLAGMRRWRGQLVRPLLGIERATVLRALAEDDQPYREDRTNVGDANARARLRSTVLPALGRVHPRATVTLARAARLLASAADLLAAEAHEAMRALDIQVEVGSASAPSGVLAAVHPALRDAIAREMLAAARGSLDGVTETHIRALGGWLASREKRTGPALRLPSGVVVAAVNGRRAILRAGSARPSPMEEVTLLVPGDTPVAGGALRVTREDEKAGARLERLLAVCGPLHALCDGETLTSPLVAGPRRAGDRLRPVGKTGSRKVQDILVDARVPAGRRDRVVIVRQGARVVWVVGYALDSRFAASRETKRLVHLRFLPDGKPNPC